MQQAAVLNCLSFDGFSPFQDGLPASGIDGGRREVADALVVSAAIVMIDEGADLRLEIDRQDVVLEQDPVLHRLMPALDLALRHRMIGRAAHVFDVLLAKPRRQSARDVARPVVRQ